MTSTKATCSCGAPSASEEKICDLDGVNGDNGKVPRSARMSELLSLDMSTSLVSTSVLVALLLDGGTDTSIL